MDIRDATVRDAESIHELISTHAQRDRMLFRSISDVYEGLRSFVVAETDGQVVGCCALKIIWSDLAEVQSLAVREGYGGQGIGRALVEACVRRAQDLGLARLFTLTLEPAFFQKVGFEVVGKASLPMKVWSDCARCPKQDHCDETALQRPLTP